MEVTVKVEGIMEALERHDHLKVRAAAASAINKTADQTRTYASKLIREEYNVPADKLRKFLKVTARSSGSGLQAVITGTGRGLALSYFGARQTGVQVSKKKGFRYTGRATKDSILKYGGQGLHGGAVSVEVRRGNRKELTSTIPRPFLAITKSGHVGVFKRAGNKRQPIEQLFGPGIGGLFAKTETVNKLEHFINVKFGPIFTHELQWQLARK